jgi:hypothetical protein
MSYKDLFEPINFHFTSNSNSSEKNDNENIITTDSAIKKNESNYNSIVCLQSGQELTVNGYFSKEIIDSNIQDIDDNSNIYLLNDIEKNIFYNYSEKFSSNNFTHPQMLIIEIDNSSLINKKRKRGKHDKFEAYNIKRKLLSNYLKFISNLVNTLIKFLLKDKNKKNVEFSKIKYNIKGGEQKFKSLKEKTIEELFLENNKNQRIYDYIISKNNIIINNILREKCFKYLFVDIYYKNKKKFNFENYGLNATIFLGSHIKTFEDLLKSNFSDKKDENEKFKNKMEKCIKKFFFETYFLNN